MASSPTNLREAAGLPVLFVILDAPTLEARGREMMRVVELIAQTLKDRDDEALIKAVRADVADLCGRFTPYDS